ncbi:protein DpdD [Coraliomargarita sp. SDUM461003]|uniref:Protein DpdD n=1 Tax=Thalassobacterium maritimum TaxID=3041265 RepID=A0ABU1AR73_9BACT|nr:protein DpdD [Coraliomargarita sp. SDUM461003]MDQ8206663.1 protein DpdD [Coraliomargarita sp. SDUM461003]
MKLANWNDEDLLGLERFYADGCAWTMQEMEGRSSTSARSAADWVESSLPPRDNPLILPRVTESNHIYWYVIAFNEAQAEQLRGDLMAFVGSVGTQFDGQRFHLDDSDSADSALLNWIGGQWAYRLPVYRSRNKEVRRALERLRSVWRLKPQLKSTLLRTTEALLREFFLSLANGSEASSGNILDELKGSGRLSAENVVFLEIEMLAAFGRWGAIAQHSQLTYLKSMQRPRHVTELLVEALWQDELSSYADTGDVDGALHYYRTDFGVRYRSLLKTPGRSLNDSVLITFLLAAVGDEHPRVAQIPKLLGLLDGSQYFEFAQELAAQVKLPEAPKEEIPLSPVERAAQTFDRNDFDTAWQQLLSVEVSIESLRLMLECFEELESSETALIVQQRFEALDPQSQDLVFKTKRYRNLWERVETLTREGAEELPSNWRAWFEALNAGSFGDDSLLKLARESVEWDAAVYLNSPEVVRELATALSACSSEAQHVLQLSLPHLVSFFLKDGVGAREFLPIYSSLVEVLVLGDSFSCEDWNTVETLLSASLEAGLSKAQYGELFEYLDELWSSQGSVSKLDWALDTLDLLAMHSVLDAEALSSFYSAVLSRITVYSRKVRVDQWEMFRLLSDDLGFASDYQAISPDLQEVTPDAPGIDLSGKFIAIYTLTESAGARAKAVIEKLFPSADVRVSSDCGGSDKLKGLAQDSDYFVVATRSAKHAATEFIKANRGKERSDLIYPAGKGSSSIVSSLFNAVIP